MLVSITYYTFYANLQYFFLHNWTPFQNIAEFEIPLIIFAFIKIDETGYMHMPFSMLGQESLTFKQRWVLNRGDRVGRFDYIYNTI
jgi:hypothetical protein